MAARKVSLSEIPELVEAVDALAPTRGKQAAALGIDDRSYRLYRSDGLPELWMRLLERPAIADALARAARRLASDQQAA